MTVSDIRDEYRRLKHAYHVAGKRALGKAGGSAEQLAYETAKREFHRAGDDLRRAEESVRDSRK